MKPLTNKLIRAIGIVLCAGCILSACTPQSQKEPPTEKTTEGTTAAVTTTAPAETTTEEPSTQEATTAESTTAQPTTKPRPQTTVPTTAIPETTTATEVTTLPEQSDFEKVMEGTATILGCYFMTPEKINETAADIAQKSDVYYVRLQDGTKTYYIAVDLQTAQALTLANPQVLRALCKELEAIQQEKADGEDYVLMDYTHLVGELEVHFVGYLLTGALGGESGPLASFYNSCKVADLNIDESRFGPIIDVIGAIYG
ncbi:MAG: hypothetical protein IJE63_08210 [Clostridia bacterium]|nr:hypothetical protein [Clostridia bacterium]